MAGRKVEVELIIKARQTAQAAIDLIAASIRRLSGAQAQVGATAATAQAGLNRTADAAKRATAVLATRTGRPFLGLRPYELQNLSFQINDIFTQLASGTSLQQTLAQQAGQIAQIFPKAIAAIIRFLPLIAAVTLAVTPFIQAFQRVGRLASDTREFGNALALSADGARTTGAELALLARRLDELGLSADDAREVVRTFLDAGIDSSQFQRLGTLAQTVAEVLGIEVTEAAEKLAEAFAGDFDEVVKLDQALNFLTASQRRQLQAMADAGREAQAVEDALVVLEERGDDVAEKAGGPWSEAFTEIGVAWNGMVNAIRDSGFSEFIGGVFDDLGVLVREFVKDLRFFTTFLLEGEAAARANQRSIGSVIGGRVGTAGAVAPAETEAQIKAREDRQRAERERAEREAERAAERAAEAREDFQQHLDDLEFEASLIGKSVEEQAILTAFREAQLDAQEAGVTLTEQELASLRESLELIRQRTAAEEQRVKALQEAKDAAEQEADLQADVLEKLKEEADRAAEKTRELNERISDGLTDALDDALSGTISLSDALRQMAADFLRDIAKMILQQQIFNAVQAAGGFFGGGTSVPVKHSGGLAGAASPRRTVHPGLFANAVRYHGGGFAGLRPGEVPAVLKRNEEVLAESDPRHAFNAGSQKPQDIKIVNTIDPGEFVSQGLSTREGEQAFMNAIGANRTTIRNILG